MTPIFTSAQRLALAYRIVEAMGHAWVPVTERLPERATAVLIVTDDDDDPEFRGVLEYAEIRGHDGRWYFIGGEYPISTPSHWMPLPAPPGPEGIGLLLQLVESLILNAEAQAMRGRSESNVVQMKGRG